MKLSSQSFLNDVESICKRPQMYAKNGDFWEILVFIQGLAIGSGVHGMQGSHAGIQDFFHWLEKKVGVHQSFKWFSIESFYAVYPNDEAALKDFARYYREFCEGLPDEEDDIKLKVTESEAIELFNFLGEDENFRDLKEKIKKELWRNSNQRDYLLSKEDND